MQNRLTPNAVRQLVRYQSRVRANHINQINKNKVSKLVGVAKRKSMISQTVRKKQQQQQQQKQKQVRKQKAKGPGGGVSTAVNEAATAANEAAPAAAATSTSSGASGNKTTSKGNVRAGWSAETGAGNRKTAPEKATGSVEGADSPMVKTSPRTAKPTTKVIEMRKLNAKMKKKKRNNEKNSLVSTAAVAAAAVATAKGKTTTGKTSKNKKISDAGGGVVASATTTSTPGWPC